MSIIKELRQIVGEAYASDDRIQRSAYRTGWYPERKFLLPDFVAAPATTDEVSRILSLANNNKIPVVPWGGGTAMAGQTIPEFGGITLDMARMKSIKDLDEESRCVTTQTGIRISKLNRYLEKFKLHFPHSPESRNTAVIGGVISTAGGAGTFFTRYGHAYDMVLGLEVVLPDGRVIRINNKERTESGYDLLNLFTKAEGTLGVITEATLRVRKQPAERKILCYSFENFKDAVMAARDMFDSGIVPEGMFIEDSGHMSLTSSDQIPMDQLGTQGAFLMAIFGGGARVTAFYEEELRQTCERYPAQKAGDDFVAEWWKHKEVQNPPTAKFSKDGWFALATFGVPISQFDAVDKLFWKTSIEHGLDPAGIRYYIKQPFELVGVFYSKFKPEETEKYRPWAEDFILKAMELGCSGPRIVGDGHKYRKIIPAIHGSALDVMTEIKKTIDPNNIMNPGKKIPK